MGLLKTSEEFPFGSPVVGAYVRVAKMFYDFNEKFWKAEMHYYLSVQSREMERLVEHLSYIYDASIVDTKPDGMTDDRWKKVIYYWSLEQGVNKLGRLTFGVSAEMFGVDTIDPDIVYAKMYEHLKLQICAGSSDVTEDATIEDIMTRLLPT
jgi:hypothetical protein